MNFLKARKARLGAGIFFGGLKSYTVSVKCQELTVLIYILCTQATHLFVNSEDLNEATDLSAFNVYIDTSLEADAHEGMYLLRSENLEGGMLCFTRRWQYCKGQMGYFQNP